MSNFAKMPLLLLLLLVLSCSVAFAGQTNLRGMVIKVDGNQLTILNSNGRESTVRSDSHTMAVSRVTKQRVNVKKIRQGSMVNIVEQNGYIKVLVVEEVPK